MPPSRPVPREHPHDQPPHRHCVQPGLSHKEASYVLAMQLGTAKTHAARGKAKLKMWLADWHGAKTEEA